MAIRPEFYVKLKGRDYPVYAGVLIAATEAGLKSLRTKIDQRPSPENGHMAIVTAIAEFEDGRIFEDVGDASPANCSPGIAAAALRMASTRAKGRVLRDAIGLGETLKEELPDDEEAPGNGRQAHAPVRPVEQKAPAQAPSGVVCEVCQTDLNSNNISFSQHHLKRNLCPEHAREEIGRRTAGTAS